MKHSDSYIYIYHGPTKTIPTKTTPTSNNGLIAALLKDNGGQEPLNKPLFLAGVVLMGE